MRPILGYLCLLIKPCIMEVKKILCPIKGKTTNDVCAALNVVVPEIEAEFGKIDLNTIDIKPDGENLVLTVSTITEEHS